MIISIIVAFVLLIIPSPFRGKARMGVNFLMLVLSGMEANRLC